MSLKLIDEGYDFQIVVTQGWVFRFPRRADAEEWLRTEVEALPALAAALPVAVPHFEHVSRDPAFVAYRLIEGQPLAREDPDGVRAFLDALHSADAPVPRPDWQTLYRSHCERFAKTVVPLLEPGDRDAAAALFAEVETLTGYEPAVVHCDLGPAHLLVREGKLAGVIDWSHVSWGDPAVDYAWLAHVPFAEWELDDELRRRSRFYHRLGPWFEADYGLRFDKPDYVRDGLAGIVRRLHS
ncbi:MAG TPA: phosphotransferase [Gaiellaceae bacterium]|nr:phosphotransferase [Gaiellaceae bacterium]